MAHSVSQFVTASELLRVAEEPLSWTVDEILLHGGLSMLVGAPKCGKSTLARGLTLQVARGEPWLGRETRQGSVLYAALEESKQLISHQFEQLGLLKSDPVTFHFGLQLDLQTLQRWVASNGPTLVVVDTFMRFAQLAEGNEYANATLAMNPLISLARESGAHLLLLHHSRKSGGEGGAETLGSTAFAASVDTIMSIKVKDGTRTLYSVQRAGTPIDRVRLCLDADTGSVSDDDTQQAQISERLRAMVLDAIGENGGEMHQSDILNRSKINRNRASEALRTLVELGQLEREGGGKRNDPFRYLIPDPDVRSAENTNGHVPS